MDLAGTTPDSRDRLLAKAGNGEPADQRICTRCVADTVADPDIRFDEQGVCNYCALHGRLHDERRARSDDLDFLFDRVRHAGRGRRYDSVIGISGGVDSSYVTHLAAEHGLRSLVVHFDNGWNSELAVDNIRRILNKTGFDLHTLVVDWAEFSDSQRALFKASVVDIEIATDHAITATMMKLAREHSIRYVLSGSNQATESGMPVSWSWHKQDWINIRAVHRRFGHVRLRTFPRYGSLRMLWDRFFNPAVTSIPVLDYLDYKKTDAIGTLSREYGWRAYGGKHYESQFTKFYQAYVLPTKFGIDKRKAHLSSLIRNGEITRDMGLAELEKPLYPPRELAIERAYVLKKLGFSDQEFDDIMGLAPKKHTDYPSDASILEAIRWLNRSLGLRRFLRR